MALVWLFETVHDADVTSLRLWCSRRLTRIDPRDRHTHHSSVSGYPPGPSFSAKTLHRSTAHWHARAARRRPLPRERFSPLALSGGSRQRSRMPAIEGEADGRRTGSAPPGHRNLPSQLPIRSCHNVTDSTPVLLPNSSVVKTTFAPSRKAESQLPLGGTSGKTRSFKAGLYIQRVVKGVVFPSSCI